MIEKRNFVKTDFTDYEWYCLTKEHFKYPEFCDMFDRDNNLVTEYLQQSAWLTTFEIKIRTISLTQKFLEKINASKELIDIIIELIFEYGENYFKVKCGDNWAVVTIILCDDFGVVEEKQFNLKDYLEL